MLQYVSLMNVIGSMFVTDLFAPHDVNRGNFCTNLLSNRRWDVAVRIKGECWHFPMRLRRWRRDADEDDQAHRAFVLHAVRQARGSPDYFADGGIADLRADGERARAFQNH